MRAATAVVVVAALLALAGCTGDGATTTGGPDGELTTGDGRTTADRRATGATTASTGPGRPAAPTTTGRPTASTATRRTTATVPASALPPGIDENGIADREALIAAFEAVAADTDYRLSATYRNVLDPSGERARTTTIRFRLNVSDADRRALGVRDRREAVGNRSGTRSERFYQADSTLYTRIVELGNLSYDVNRQLPFERAQARTVTAPLARSGFVPLRWNWTVAGTATVDGEEAVRLSLAGAGDQAEGVRVRRAEGTALIDSRGAVRRLDVEAVLVDSGEARRAVSITYRFDPAASVRVDPPAWLDEARSATAAG